MVVGKVRLNDSNEQSDVIIFGRRETMNELERGVTDLLTAGDHPVLERLRRQLESVRVVGRTYTGVGFYTDLEVDHDVPRVTAPLNFELDDVWAKMDGLQNGVGFVLFVREGVASLLEGYTIDEPWPDRLENVVLSYSGVPRQLPLEQRVF